MRIATKPFHDLCWLIRHEVGRAQTGLVPSFYLALLRRAEKGA